MRPAELGAEGTTRGTRKKPSAGAAASRADQRGHPSRRDPAPGRPARLRRTDRRGVRGRQGQGPRHLRRNTAKGGVVMARSGRAGVLERPSRPASTARSPPCRSCSPDDVSGWSPNMLVSSLDELAEAVAERDESLSNVSLQIHVLDVVGNKGYAEYRVNAVFSGPFVVDDETVIEPNGRELLLGGRHRGGVRWGQDLGVPQLLRRRRAAGADARRLAGAESAGGRAIPPRHRGLA